MQRKQIIVYHAHNNKEALQLIKHDIYNAINTYKTIKRLIRKGYKVGNIRRDV